MKKPITLDTGINFVLVGSLLDGSGILIKDESSTIDLIGVARELYIKGPKTQLVDKLLKFENPDINQKDVISFIWSDSQNLSNSSRSSHFLFAIKGNLNENLKSKIYHHTSMMIINNYNSFLEDSFFELDKFSSRQPYNVKSHEYDTNKAIFTWNISEFLTLIKLNFILPDNSTVGRIFI